MTVSDTATLNTEISHSLPGAAQSALPGTAAKAWSPALRLVPWLAAFALALWIMFAQGGGVHNDFTQNVWLPSRLVLNGADPYNATLSQVNSALGSYASDFKGFNSGAQFHFIYPMWLALLFVPFAMLPLTVALALWRAINLILLVWGITRVLKAANPVFRSARPQTIAAIVLTAFLALVYRESILTLFLGQFSIFEFALLAGVWGYLVHTPQSKEGVDTRLMLAGDVLVGVGLAVLATKPQAVGLPVALLGLWAISRKRWAIPVSAVASLALLLVVPLLAFPSSLQDWLGILTGGQAGSQSQVSASVWGVSYQLLGDNLPWTALALFLTFLGLVALIPSWLRDLKDRTSPVPMSLALTLCINSVVSPYMLGYEHVLLLFPALLMLAAAGLPDEQTGRGWKMWRMAVYGWMAALPYLLVAVEAGLGSKEYVVIVQSLSMLALVYVARFRWNGAMPGSRDLIGNP